MIFDLQRFAFSQIHSVSLPASKYNTFETNDGMVYYARTRFVKESDEDSSYTVAVITEYDSSGKYGKLYEKELYVITINNYTKYESELNEKYESQLKRLKESLGNVIGDVTVPIEQNELYATKSGKQFYMSTGYELQSWSETEAYVEVVTSYRLSVGNEVVYKRVRHRITADNYGTYESDLKAYSKTHFKDIRNNILAPWDVNVPGQIVRVFTNQGGETYYIKAYFYQGVYTDTFNQINCKISYGTTEATSSAVSVEEIEFAIDMGNCRTFQTDAVEKANEAIDRAIEKVNVPSIRCPVNTSEVYTVNGFSYSLRVMYEKGDAINVVIVKAYLDEVQYGNTRSETFMCTQEEADVILAGISRDFYTGMRERCSGSPENVAEQYEYRLYRFTIETVYMKAANSTNVFVRTYVDGGLYKSSTVKIDVSNIVNSIVACSEEGARLVESVKSEIKGLNPSQYEVFTPTGGIAFDIEVDYSKDYMDQYVLVEIYCDKILYQSFTGTLIPSNMQSSNKSIKTMADTRVSNLKAFIASTVPSSTDRNVTVRGLTYNLSSVYTKTNGRLNVKGYAAIDTSRKKMYSLEWNIGKSFEEYVARLVEYVKTDRDGMEEVLNKVELDGKSERVYVGSVGYDVSLSYSKDVMKNYITYIVRLDNSVYSSIDAEFNPVDLEMSLNMIKESAEAQYQSLKDKLELTPSPMKEEYQKGNFQYVIETAYSKSRSSPTMSISISLDGRIADAFIVNVYGNSIESDLEEVKRYVDEKVSSLKQSLTGLPNTVEEYVVGDCVFGLEVRYGKNEDGNLVIEGYIDGEKYGRDVASFDPAASETYLRIGQDMMEEMRVSLKGFPGSKMMDHANDTFMFTIGYRLEKAIGSKVVKIHPMIDGEDIWDATEIEYDMNSLKILTDTGERLINTIIDNLRRCPYSYTNIYRTGEMYFSEGISYSKSKNDKTVLVQSILDDKVYREDTVEFDIERIGDISSKGDEMEEALKRVLDTFPRTYTEEYEVRRFVYAITRVIKKNYGETKVISYVTVDGRLYGEQSEKEFDINDFSTATEYVDEVVERLKTKLQEITPENFHMNYTRSKDVFIVDCYFSKKANSNDVAIEYVINDAESI